jgi:carbon storage regulator CsrA
MLVIARKRSETLIIDGTIRVEVLSVSGGMARLRFLAPRRIPISRGVVQPASAAFDEAASGGLDASGKDPVGLRVEDLLLAKTQVVTLGTEIHMGLVDIDSARALIFVDAPRDVSVQAGETEKPEKRKPSRAEIDRGQGMLAFPQLPSAETDANATDPRESSTDSRPGTIPFKRPEN